MARARPSVVRRRPHFEDCNLRDHRRRGREAETEKFARIGLARAEEAIRRHPDSNLPLELGAPALAALGEREKAIAWITRALEIDPDDNITRYNAACTYALLGEGI